MKAGEATRDQPQNFGRERPVSKVDELGPESIGHDLIEAAFVDKPVVDHRLCESLSVEICLLEHVFHLRRLQNALLENEISDLIIVHLGRGAELIQVS